MAIQEIKEDPEADSFAKEQLNWRSIEADKDREWQHRMRRLDIEGNTKIEMIKVDAATKRLKATTRSDLWARIGIAVVKSPALPLAVLCVFILQLRGKNIPEILDKFLNI